MSTRVGVSWSRNCFREGGLGQGGGRGNLSSANVLEGRGNVPAGTALEGEEQRSRGATFRRGKGNVPVKTFWRGGATFQRDRSGGGGERFERGGATFQREGFGHGKGNVPAASRNVSEGGHFGSGGATVGNVLAGMFWTGASRLRWHHFFTCKLVNVLVQPSG